MIIQMKYMKFAIITVYIKIETRVTFHVKHENIYNKQLKSEVNKYEHY